MDERYIELNRLRVTGPLTLTTPTCVIAEVATTLRIGIDVGKLDSTDYVDKVIKAITSTVAIPRIKYPQKDRDDLGYSQAEWRMIVGFINADQSVQWKISSLKRAYLHLMRYYNVKEPPLPEEGKDFAIGQQTQDQPETYNACILYRICHYYGIRMTRSTDIRYMGQAVSYLYSESTQLKELLSSQIENLSRSSIINLLMSSDARIAPSPNLKVKAGPMKVVLTTLPSLPSWDPDRIDSKLVATKYTALTSLSDLLPRVLPASHEEAIILGAIVYSINLSECINPHAEYLHLRKITGEGVLVNRYVPISDSRFRQRYQVNPKWFDIRVTWTPRIRPIYSEEDLRKFALAEGYSTSEVSSRKALRCLEEARASSTFYVGYHPSLVDIDGKGGSTQRVTHTAIQLTEIKDLPSELILTYGNLSQPDSLTVYSIPELKEWFTRSRNYTDPKDARVTFSKLGVRKLRYICRSYLPRKNGRSSAAGGSKCSTEIEKGYLDLAESLEMVEDYLAAGADQAKRLTDLFTRSDEKIQEAIKRTLISLLHLCYYMRGWKCCPENQEPPIGSHETNFDKDYQGQVDLNVTNATLEFERQLENLPPDVKEVFTSLPLIRAQKQEGHGIRFQPTTDKAQGLTVLERIKIVKDGSTVYACIRLSSNLLMASAYYYMLACQMSPPFPIRQLAEIS